MARSLQEFESQARDEESAVQNNEYREQGLATQKAFQSKVKSLVGVISEMGNPFLDDCPELLALDTRNWADKSVVCSL